MLCARYITLTFIGCLAVALPPTPVTAQSSGAAPQSIVVDPRILTNPLLAALAKNNSSSLPAFLHELDQISATPEMALRSAQPAPTPTPEEARQIGANPAFVGAYKLNPDPMLQLLRRMMQAAHQVK